MVRSTRSCILRQSQRRPIPFSHSSFARPKMYKGIPLKNNHSLCPELPYAHLPRQIQFHHLKALLSYPSTQTASRDSQYSKMPAYSLSNISVPKLTTTFTPPGTCLLPTFTLAPIGNDSVSPFAATTSGLDTIGASTSISRGVASECYPPEFAFATPNRVTSESTTYYLASTFSPGIICPSGYYTADQTVNEQDSNTAYGATCCPSYVQVFNTIKQTLIASLETSY